MTKTRRLTNSAMLLALAVALELAGRLILPPMPFGGRLTLCAMLPVVLVAWRHGVKWGLFSGFAYSLIQMLLGAGTVAAAFQPGYFGDGVLLGRAVLMVLLDYCLAYTVMGLGGVFGKLGPKGLPMGTGLALLARYLVHTLSGYILFSGWAEWFFTQEGFPGWGAELVAALPPQALGWAYSAVYNGLFMVPELVLTTLAAALLAPIPIISRRYA